MALLTVGVILATSALAGPAVELAKVVEAYVQAKSYASQFEVEVAKAEEGKVLSWKVTGEMAYLAPNKFLLRMEDPIGGFVVACDGRQVVSYIWPHMEYRVDPAPGSLKEFKGDPFLGLPARGPIVWQMLCAKDAEAMLGDLKSVQKRREGGMVIYEAVAESSGRGAKVVGRFSFKVGERDKVIREVRAELSLVDAGGRITAYLIRESHHGARLGGPVEESKFRFSPPKGARKVGEFSPPLP